MSRLKLKKSTPRFDASILESEQLRLHWQGYTIFLIFLLLAGFAYWSTQTHIDEVTIAQGKILPFQDVYAVQHERGGKLEKVYVQNGDIVEKGQLLARLDTRQLKKELRSIESQLTMTRKRYQFFMEQYRARQRLTKEGLNSKLSMLNVKMQRADLEAELAELAYKISSTQAAIDNADIVAPIDGTVYNRALMDEQVLAAGQRLIEIVPGHSELIAELEIPATDIGHIAQGDAIVLKISTYDYNKYGGINSTLTAIAPISDQSRNGTFYFRGLASLQTDYIDSNKGKLRVIPGMTVEAEIKTGSKTVAEYLLKPITMSAKQALRER